MTHPYLAFYLCLDGYVIDIILVKLHQGSFKFEVCNRLII